MKSTYLSRPRLVLVAVVVVLAIANILSNRVVSASFYVPFNLTITAIVVGIALTQVTRHEIGLHRWASGLRWGATVVAIGAVGYLVALLLSSTQDLFYDSRVYGGVDRLLFEIFIRIPLGTVLLEELAFRGVLPALFGQQMSKLKASLCASVLFGFWHVLPAAQLHEINPVVESMFGSGLAGEIGGVAFAVIGTTALGLWMCWLRFRSGSLLTTIISHIGSNSGAYLFAWLYGAGWLTGTLAGAPAGQ